MGCVAKVIPFDAHGGLKFGIYHGGVVETQEQLATGRPDAPDEVNRALDLLQGSRKLLVRTYLRYGGCVADDGTQALPPVSDLARYTWNGRKLDLVLSNWDRTNNLRGWVRFVEHAIDRYGAFAQCVQICEEPNLYDYPGDGRFPGAVDAVVDGMRVAKETLRRRGLDVSVGFNAVPCFDPHDGFWRALAGKSTPVFLNALDYVGLNLYLDVTEPIAGNLSDAIEQSLTRFREVNLKEAGIPHTIPIHICEHGWPTGPHRYYARQADVLELVIRKIYELRTRLNITHYELFALRDADTANPNAGLQFGIVRDDYCPKPAFETYRKLIEELGA